MSGTERVALVIGLALVFGLLWGVAGSSVGGWLGVWTVWRVRGRSVGRDNRIAGGYFIWLGVLTYVDLCATMVAGGKNNRIIGGR